MLASFWTWHGWDALVAIGTLALALTTGALALFTYLVTRDSRDELRLERGRLEASQRPIVIPAELRTGPGETIGKIVWLLTIKNAGPGVALNITTIISRQGQHYPQPVQHLSPTGVYQYVIESTETRGGWETMTGRIVAHDIAHQPWLTEFKSGPGVVETDHQTYYPLTVTAPYQTGRALLEASRRHLPSRAPSVLPDSLPLPPWPR